MQTQPPKPPFDTIRHEICLSEESAWSKKVFHHPLLLPKQRSTKQNTLCPISNISIKPAREGVRNGLQFSQYEDNRAIYPSAQTAAAWSKQPAAEEQCKLSWIELKPKSGIHH